MYVRKCGAVIVISSACLPYSCLCTNLCRCLAVYLSADLAVYSVPVWLYACLYPCLRVSFLFVWLYVCLFTCLSVSFLFRCILTVDRQTDTDRQTDRQRDREAETDRNRQRVRDRDRVKDRDRDCLSVYLPLCLIPAVLPVHLLGI